MDHGADLATVDQAVTAALNPLWFGKSCVICLQHLLRLDLVYVMHQLLTTLIAQGACCGH